MPIDYSKWDKIELSDDSDIEVHPNVDKKSFIKWKQQSIHEQRLQRNQDIKNLEFQLQMNDRLNRRVDKMLNTLSDSELLKMDSVQQFLNANFDKTERGQGDHVDPDMPTYNEMVEDLFEQMELNAKKEGKDPKDGAVIREMILRHRKKIDQVNTQATDKLSELYRLKNSLISSDDIHTGFDKSFVNKMAEGEDASKFIPKQPASETSLIGSLSPPPMEFIDFKDDAMKLAPETLAFGKIAPDKLKKSEEFLLQHLPIISEQQKDALMMTAFEHQMEGDEVKAYQAIHQSELLAYIRELYDIKKIPFLRAGEMTKVIKMFFERVFFKSADRGRASFLESVQAKFDHVKQRVKVMEHESPQEGVETIQLKSLDDSTELHINLPDFNSEASEEVARREAFNKLPTQMQTAVQSQSLDQINEVFSEMSLEEAERVLDIFNEGGIIGINAILEDESEFKELQDQYESERNANQLEEGEDVAQDVSKPLEEDLNEGTTNTSDVVD
ncbi:LAMI_0H17678g1_1 [Lachancea mirantina]|uniref:Hsp90 chaperone protein kinase-targeting subunit n=1 Tax=Lachancea mirantina TaxID=1230905 RepID=A0A1G4KJH2_9SACH|nr:LAMI_0H17678g1_1 [Lachancea mirantina]